MEAEPPQRWAATYTKHVKQKRKAYHDGALLLYPASGRLVLLDDAGCTLESRFRRSSEEVSPGAALSFQAHLIDVGEPEDGPASYTSAASGSRTARRGGGGRARPPSSGRVFPPRVSRAFVNPSKRHGCSGGGNGEAAGSGGAEVAESRFQEWTALYTAQLTQKAKKYHDGFVRLVGAGPHVKQIVLLDEDGQVLGSRHLKSGESIESGKKCHFPNYLIEICEAINQNKGGQHTSEESMVHTRSKNRETPSNKMELGASSKSQKFVSPQKFHDLDNTKSEVSTGSGKPEADKGESVAADCPGSFMEEESGYKETKHSLKDASNQTGLRNKDNTCDKTSEKSKSPKFVSPFKFQESADSLKSNWESTAGSNRPQIANTTCSNLDAPQNFHVHSDLQKRKSDFNVNGGSGYSELTFDIHRGSVSNSLPDFGKSTSSRNGGPLQFYDHHDGKSGCSNISIRREVGKSNFGDDSLRTASQILSIMKPPSEARISLGPQSVQAHSLASSKARITFDGSCRKNSVVDDRNRNFDGNGTSGMSHFEKQLRASVRSCLNLETPSRKNLVSTDNWNESSGDNHGTYSHQSVMRPAAFEGQDLTMFDIPASDVSNAKEQKLGSSSQRSGSYGGTESCFNFSTEPSLQEDKRGSANQISTADGKCDGPTSTTSEYTLTCKDPRIQELIDDCPSFDLGFEE